MCYVRENTTRGERIKIHFNFLLFVYIICCISLCKCIFHATHSFFFSPLYVPSLFAYILHCSKYFLLPMIALFSMFVPYYTFPFAMLISLKCYVILSCYCFHFNLPLLCISLKFINVLSLPSCCCVFCCQSCNEMVPVANLHVCRRYVCHDVRIFKWKVIPMEAYRPFLVSVPNVWPTDLTFE
jgi:hypothetical protein